MLVTSPIKTAILIYQEIDSNFAFHNFRDGFKPQSVNFQKENRFSII